MTEEARQRWQRKLDYLLAEEATASNASQKFELQEQIAECRAKLDKLDAEDRRRPAAGTAAASSAAIAPDAIGDVTAVEALIQAARKEGLVLRAEPLTAAGATQLSPADAADSTPLPDSVLTDFASRQVADNFAGIRERYLNGDRRSASEALDALLKDEAWQHLAAPLRGRLLRTAALYRLDFRQDQAGAAALAERAKREDPSGDDQALTAHLAIRRGDKYSALDILGVPHSREARHLKAAMLIDRGNGEAALGLLAEPGATVDDAEPAAASQTDPVDADGNTAETWRLRGLAHLALKQLPEALEAIEAARALAPDRASVRSTTAVIDFWRACTPAALTLAEQPLWPMPFARELVPADSGGRLAEIEQRFAEIAEAMPLGSDEQGHWLTWRLIALLVASYQQETATELTDRLIGDDGPPHIWPLAWAWFYRMDMDTARLKQRLKSIPDDDPNYIPFTELYVDLRLQDDDFEALLTELDEIEPKVAALGHPLIPHHWRAVTLSSAGRIDEALAIADGMEDERQRLRLRLLIARDQEADRPGSHKEAAAALFAVEPSIAVLAEACDVHAAAGDWPFVTAHADALLEAIPTPRVLRLLAIAAFNQGEYRRCMVALDEHRDVHVDGRLPRDLKLLRVRCQRMLGDVSQAVRDARLLYEQNPSAEHLVELLNLQVEAADRTGMLDSLRGLLGIESSNGDHLLQAARIAVQLDRELAAALWRKGVELGSDEASFPALAATVGSNLGLPDEETGPWFRRMAELAEAGKGGSWTSHISDLPDMLRKQRTAETRIWELYGQGDLPVHGLCDHLGLTLTAHHHETPAQNRTGPDPLVQHWIPIRHGARPMRQLASHRDRDCRLILDLTALVTAHSLGLLDLVERAFAPLWIPAQWHLLLLNEIERLRPNQPRRSAAADQVARLIRSRGIQLADLTEGPTPADDISALLGERQAQELALMDSMDGYLLTYLPLHGPDLRHWEAVDLPERWQRVVLGPRALLDRLFEQDAIDSEDHRRGLAAFPPEPASPDATLKRGTPVLASTTLLEQLADKDLLTSVCTFLRLFVPQHEWDLEKERVAQQARAAVLIQWIEALIDRVAEGQRSERYRLVPTMPAEDEGTGQYIACLEGLLKREGQTGDLLWTDDRHLNGYPATGQTLIIGVAEVLDLLVGRGRLSHAQRFDYLHRLRASNYRFIPLEAEEILHWLKRSQPRAGKLQVPEPLLTLARYWAACLAETGGLRFRNDPRHAVGESPFFVSSQSAVATAMRQVWEDRDAGERIRDLRANWLLDNLYLGVADVAHLLPEETSDADMSRVGTDIASLVVAALPMLIPEAKDGKRAVKRRRSNATSYMSWICQRIIEPRLLADAAAVEIAAGQLSSAILAIFGEDDPELLSVIGSHLLKLVPALPRSLRQALHKDQSFMQQLGLAEVSVVEVEKRKFARSELLGAVEAAIAGEEPEIIDLTRRRAVQIRNATEPGSSRPIVDLIDEQGHSLGKHYFPYTELLSSSRALRVQALRENPAWWDGASMDCESVERELGAVSAADERIRRVASLSASSADQHYAELTEEWWQDKRLKIDRCFPPALSAVLTFVRCNDSCAAGPIAERCWENLVRTVPAERGLGECLRRITLLPCPLPADVHRCVATLDVAERREVLQGAAREMFHPIGHLHLIDLLLANADSLPEALSLVQEQIGHLSKPEFASELDLVRTLVDLSYRAFQTEAEQAGIEPRRQLLAAWVHAGRVAGILLAGGASPRPLADDLDVWAPFPVHDLYADGQEPTMDLAWPVQVQVADIVFAGLGTILGRHPDLVPKLDLSVLADRLGSLESGAPDPIEDVYLLRDPALLADSLACLWGGDRSVALTPLIGPEKAQSFAPATFSDRVDACIERLAAEPEHAETWQTLFLTTFHGTLAQETAERLGQVFEQMDLGAVIASDPQLLTPLMEFAVRYRTDRDSVVNLIYSWANDFDDRGVPTTEIAEWLGAEATTELSERIIAWVHRLAIRHPGGTDEEFARLLAGLIRPSARLASALRDPLLSITRRLPFSRHRALHATLIAARARSELPSAEKSPPGPPGTGGSETSAHKKVGLRAGRRRRRKRAYR
ncbi:tetratricopeptide repeat protein [uncultured Thiohalocapsa sp.]|uniref:HTH domain-containing protein n=1 Tax=uncultured Thiohalocapsa sp. TaxID=768990 RepID=UPI0025EB4FE8|nr:tetratricopeptide repeat protein [uncultured Thiohalocapsa sp.]